MYASLDDLLADNPPRFDLVSLVHVLEHLPDPVGMLSTIRRELLNESGHPLAGGAQFLCS
jgi:2-polyprenyl-3-methyl-5-hydroxy-6-metoxy-1,4-benzoquinol methylase